MVNDLWILIDSDFRQNDVPYLGGLEGASRRLAPSNLKLNSVIAGLTRNLFLFFLFLFLFLSSNSISAQKKPQKTCILFVFDCSGSMWESLGNGGPSKIVTGKSILTRIVDSLNNIPNVEMSLRTFGAHAPPRSEDCHDTRSEVAFQSHNAEDIKDAIQKMQPNGTTPIAYSLSQAGLDFPSTTTRNIIILITDGIEECKGDPCAVSRSLQERKVVLKPFIIGLNLTDDLAANYNCVGKFYNTKTAADFSAIFGQVLSQALNNTTMEVDLLDDKQQATETNENMTFYNVRTGVATNNYYNTFNALGRPDTFTADPAYSYNLQIHTTPETWKNDVALTPAKHNIVKINAPQGNLQLNMNGIDQYNHPKCLVKKAGDDKVIFVQDFNTIHRFLTGSYDLEMLTLPRTIIKGVKINSKDQKKIEVAQPGVLDISYNGNIIGSIYVLRDNSQEMVVNLTGNMKKEFYRLQPGSYRIVYRNKESSHAADTNEKDFKITTGGSISLSL